MKPKTMKISKTLSMLLALIMIIGVFAAAPVGLSVSALSGDGTSIANAYVVNTYDELREVMKTRAWMSSTTNDTATYIKLNSDILIEDSQSDYYLETFYAANHYLQLNLNGHSLIRRTTSSDKYMIKVKCHLLIVDLEGGGTIRFKTSSTDGDTAVFYNDSTAFFLEICNDAYIVNDTAENSDYTNCGVLSTGYGDKKVFVYESRIAAQLPIKMTGNGTGCISGAALCSTSKSSYVALNLQCNSINIYNCSAYGDIILDTNYSSSIYDALNGTTIYRNGIEKDFSSIRKPDVRTATLSANGGVLTVTKNDNPFIENIDVTDVTAPLGGTKVGDFKYTVKTENVIDVGVTICKSNGIALTSDKLFVGDESYKYYIHVMPKGGYMFKANATTGVSTGTINGESVETVTHPSWYSSMGTDIRLISTFTAIQGVTGFSATIKEPAVGTTPDFNPVPGDSKAYTVTYVNWNRKLSANVSISMAEDSAFEYGCEYILTIRFDLNEGYTLADTSNKLPGTINGETADNRSPINDKYAIFVITYKMPDAPTEQLEIIVYGGAARNDSGYRISRAAPGTKVNLTANEPSAGRVFDRWSVSGDITTVEDIRSKTTSFIMPESAVTISAVSRDESEPPTPEYNISVLDGKATNRAGTVITTAFDNDLITITANDAPAGKVFDKWVVLSGDITIYEPSSETTSFRMPESNVSVKATYKDETSGDFIYGDLTRDGKVNLMDLVALRKYLAKWSIEVDTAAADCNADSKVNLMDLILLRKYLAKWSVTLGPQS